jgi:hypothetical protein
METLEIFQTLERVEQSTKLEKAKEMEKKAQNTRRHMVSTSRVIRHKNRLFPTFHLGLSS